MLHSLFTDICCSRYRQTDKLIAFPLHILIEHRQALPLPSVSKLKKGRIALGMFEVNLMEKTIPEYTFIILYKVCWRSFQSNPLHHSNTGMLSLLLLCSHHVDIVNCWIEERFRRWYLPVVFILKLKVSIDTNSNRGSRSQKQQATGPIAALIQKSF